MQAFKGRLTDPNRVNLRKAARASLVVPTVFAIFVVAGNSAAALFGAFGAFAALVFSDFGGPLPRRFRAYVLLAVVGAALDVLGTAAADPVGVAVVVTLLVVFLVSFSGALGGYFAAAGTSAMLAFVLAVMTPGVEADLWSRQLGWLVGVLAAGVSACVLWPVHQRDRARVAAASVLREAAAALAVPASHRDVGALRAADDALAARAGVVYRPAGSITRERALVALVIATRRLLPLVERVTRAETSSAADPTPEYAALSARVSESLAASADIVASETAADTGAERVTHAREVHSEALERWASSVIPAEGAARVIDGFTATFPLRRLSLAAVQVAEDADVAARDALRSRADRARALSGAWSMLRAHCNLHSVRFRNAARAALGLALAVLVAKTTSVEHAFWVVLAALSVLRSNALGTGATALQALAGAFVGFCVAAALMETMGGDDTWLWIALPIVVFLAAYTPGAVNFVVGQAGFTVFVVVLFNIFVPEGWRTGLVRVQDIAIGAGISVAVGALLWPRGARGVARRAFAELLRAGTAHLTVALQVALRGRQADLAGAAASVADARARAVAALEDLSLEHGGGHVDHEGWGALLVEALVIELAADGIVRAGRLHEAPPICAGAAKALAQEGNSVAESVDEEADRLVTDGVRSLTPLASTAVAVPPELTECLAHHGDDATGGAIDLIWVYEWVALLSEHRR